MAFPPASGVSVAELSRLPEAELRSRVLARPRPRHVAIIMDGNGRWATRRGLPRVAGHHQGVKAVRETVRQVGELGIDFLTLYAFSSENWQRPETEVSFLMTLLERTIDGELPDLMAKNVRFRVIGRSAGIPPGVRRRIEHVVTETAANTGLTLVLALNYGGRDEIVDAVRGLARDLQRRGIGQRRTGRKCRQHGRARQAAYPGIHRATSLRPARSPAGLIPRN